MTAPAGPDRPAEPLAYEPATDEERARVRAEVRQKLADARERHTPEYYAQLRARFGVTAA
jgi:hypothetical protein